MTAAANLDWLYHLLGYTLAAAGLALLLWSLFWDRPRGRRRCPKCWYDMSGVPGLKCPECGQTCRSDRALKRTRRRWIGVLPALLLGLAGYCTTRVPLAVRHGWHRAVPSTILVVVAPLGPQAWKWTPLSDSAPFGQPADPLTIELVRRVQARELSSWQSQMFFDRFYGKNPEQRSHLITLRDRWPRGVPIEFRAFGPEPLRESDDMVLRVRIRRPKEPWTEIPLSDSYRWSRAKDIRQRLGMVSELITSVDIEAELLGGATVESSGSQVTNVDASTAKPIWRGVVGTVRLANAAAELLEPVPSPRAAGTIQGRLKPTLVSDHDGAIKLQMFNAGSHIGEGKEDWALGLRVEVLRNQERVGNCEILYPLVTKGVSANLARAYSYFEIQWTGAPPTDQGLQSDDWDIVLRGDPNVALKDLLRNSYWDGEVRIRQRTLGRRPDWDRW